MNKPKMLDYLQSLIERTTDHGFCQLLNLIKNDCEKLDTNEFITNLRLRGNNPYLTNGQNELNIGMSNFYLQLAKDLTEL